MTRHAELDDARRAAADEAAASIDEHATELSENRARAIISNDVELYEWITAQEYDIWPDLSRALDLIGKTYSIEINRDAAAYMLKKLHDGLLESIQCEVYPQCLRRARQEHQAAQNRLRYRSEEE